MTTPEEPRNRLGGETSLYLLSHAENPVAWWPYGDEAFAEARRLNLPLLLSIGYSACHWCHVMAHESFEDGETAKLINSRFVPVKVDREERPDVDEVAMRSALALGGRGGWPLHVFLTPEGRPFYAGTYFPPAPRMGMASFRQVLLGISGWFQDRRDQVEEQAQRLETVLVSMESSNAPGHFDLQKAHATALEQLRAMADGDNGGWGRAPKFPEPSRILLSLRSPSPEDGGHALRTLEGIARGGITDQLAGGVSRYSVDGFWAVPHFEKMLYDNAQLLAVFSEGAQVATALGRPDLSRRFRGMVEGIYAYLESDLKCENGMYYAAEDADSEGEEGKFYAFSAAEFREALPPLLSSTSGHALEFLMASFGVSEEGNFEGSNVLSRPAGDHSQRFGLSAEEGARLREEATEALFAYRAGRVRPQRDEKCLLGWNALAAAALLRAGAFLNDERFTLRGVELCRTLCENFVIAAPEDAPEMGAIDHIAHSMNRGVLKGEAFADDVAALMEACALAASEDSGFLEVTAALAQWFLKGNVRESGKIHLSRARSGFAAVASREEDGVVPSPQSLAFSACRLALDCDAAAGSPLMPQERDALMDALRVARVGCEKAAEAQPLAMCRFLADAVAGVCVGGVCPAPGLPSSS